MLRRLLSKLSKRQAFMAESKRLHSPNTPFAGEAIREDLEQDQSQKNFVSTLICVQCHDSARRKSPGEIVRGFLFRMPGSPCEKTEVLMKAPRLLE